MRRRLWLLPLALTLIFSTLWWYRPGMPAYQRHLMPTQPARGDHLSETWLGVTALLLRDAQHAILIDPFFTRPPGFLPMLRNARIEPNEALIQAWLGKLDLQWLDAVLVSHSHFDHAMDAGVVARLTGAALAGSQSTLNIGLGAGLSPDRLHLAAAGEIMEFGSFRVQFIQSEHAGASGGRPTGEIARPLRPPARYLDYKLGGTYSIMIEHAEGKMLHHGSAGFVPGRLQPFTADIVFLGVSLVDDLQRYLGQTVDAVSAKRVVPIHWDDFTRPLDRPLKPFPLAVDLNEFFEQVQDTRPAVWVQTMALNQPVRLFPPRASAD